MQKRFPRFNKTKQLNQTRPQSVKSSKAQPAKRRPEGATEEARPVKSRVVVGIHSVTEAIKVRPKKIETIWLKQDWESSAELRLIEELIKEKRIPMEVKSQQSLDKWSSGHQGIAAFVTEQPEFDWKNIEQSTQSVIVALDGLEDPHNLGAILRTSWLLGVKGILHTLERSVGLTPTVNKIACGGVEHVPLEGVHNFSNHIERLKKDGFWVYGLSAAGKSTIYDLELPDKVVWVIGSEGKGIRKTTERLCDELVSIPQIDSAASFNASVAAGITLGETFRQLQKQKK